MIQPTELQMVQAAYHIKDINRINILIGSVFESDFNKNWGIWFVKTRFSKGEEYTLSTNKVDRMIVE